MKKNNNNSITNTRKYWPRRCNLSDINVSFTYKYAQFRASLTNILMLINSEKSRLIFAISSFRMLTLFVKDKCCRYKGKERGSRKTRKKVLKIAMDKVSIDMMSIRTWICLRAPWIKTKMIKGALFMLFLKRKKTKIKSIEQTFILKWNQLAKTTKAKSQKNHQTLLNPQIRTLQT